LCCRHRGSKTYRQSANVEFRIGLRWLPPVRDDAFGLLLIPSADLGRWFAKLVA
jgi:hypothetical protein